MAGSTILYCGGGRRRRALLLGVAACALLGAAQAQDTDTTEELKAEIERLRAMIEALSEKVEAQEGEIEKEKRDIEALSEKLDAQEGEIEQEKRDIEAMRRDIEVVKTATPDESASQTPASERPRGFSVGDTVVSYGGFLKLDVSAARFSDGAPPSSSLGRDFYIPSLTPVGEGEDAETVIDFNPRETRFFFTTETPWKGHKISSRLEFDFQVTDGGDERVSNSFQPRIRQGYFDFDNWRFGMDWTTFQDVRALPEALDFIGPTEGTVFNRQPLVRYTTNAIGPGKLEIAVEQPEATVSLASGARLLPGADIAPDWAMRYTLEGAWGHVSLAGLGRILRIGDDDLFDGSRRDATLAGGASISGKINLGDRDDFRFMGTAGTGLGRYIGVNLVNGAAIDANGDLETIPTFNGFMALRHFWSQKWRSNIMVSGFYADHPVSSALSGDPTDNSISSHVNLLYSPVPNVTFGAEFAYARRGVISDAVGTIQRLQFSAKYGF